MALALIACAATTSAAAQAPGASRMDISANTSNIAKDKAMYFKGDVRAAIYSEGEERPTRIQADEVIVASPATEGGRPDKVELKGNVVVDSPQAKIRSKYALLNLSTNSMIFTGDVVGSTAEISQFMGDKVTYNSQTGETAIENLRATGVSFGKNTEPDDKQPGDKQPGASWLLSTDDVSDWPLFLKTLHDQGAASAPSPGKRLMSLLDPKQRQGLSSLSTGQTPPPQAQSMVIKVLNGLLKKKEFYDEASWKNVTLDGNAQKLLAKRSGDIQPAETIQLNRMLLQAAFPQSIRPPKP